MLIVYAWEGSDHQRQRMDRLGNKNLHFMEWIYSILLYNIMFHTEPRGYYL